MHTALLTALAMAAFAANSLLARAALDGGHLDAIAFTTVRLVSGALALGVLAGARLRTWRSGTWTSALALYVYALSFSMAYTQIPTGLGALLLFAAVQITVLGYAVAAGARPRPAEWAGLALSAAGVVVLTRPGLAAPPAVGGALMVAAGCAWGLYTWRGRHEADPLESTAGNFLRALVPALAVAAFAQPFRTLPTSPTGIGLALASGVVASAAGYAVWYRALRGLSPSGAAIIQLSVPLLAGAGGVWLLGEALTPRLVAAAPLILGGILLAVAARRPGRDRSV